MEKTEQTLCYNIEFTVDKALIRKAIHQFMLRRLGWIWMIGFVLLWIGFGFVAIQYRWDVLSNLFAGVLILGTLLLMYIYHIRLKYSDSIFKKMKEPIVRYSIDQTGITASTDLGESKMKWVAFEEILKSQDLWLLIYAKSAYLTIPVNKMSSECQRFIEQCIAGKR